MGADDGGECMPSSSPSPSTTTTRLTEWEERTDREKLAMTVAFSFIISGGVSLISMGLTVADVVTLSLCNKECRARCADNCCWEEAAEAMDSDFAFPDDYEAIIPTIMSGDSEAPAQQLPLTHWRTGSDPRCAIDFNDLPPKQRFVRLLLFGQFVKKTLAVWCKDHVDREEWTFDDISASDLEMREGEATTSWHNSRVEYARAMKELETRHAKRYDLLLKIAYARIAEYGFHQEESPYYIIDGALQQLVVAGNVAISVCATSFREWINDIIAPDDRIRSASNSPPRAPPGSDDHIRELNCAQKVVIPCSKALLGARLERTLRLLPFDDMSKLLEDHPMDDMSPASQTPPYAGVDWSPLQSHPDFSEGLGWRTIEEFVAGMPSSDDEEAWGSEEELSEDQEDDEEGE
ncbi:hypothetical protein RI054_24g101720 [Pseudoscourfieldia marina]